MTDAEVLRYANLVLSYADLALVIVLAWAFRPYLVHGRRHSSMPVRVHARVAYTVIIFYALLGGVTATGSHVAFSMDPNEATALVRDVARVLAVMLRVGIFIVLAAWAMYAIVDPWAERRLPRLHQVTHCLLHLRRCP